MASASRAVLFGRVSDIGMTTPALHTRWLASLDIPAVLRRVLALRPDIQYALVSMIDSTPGVGNLPSLVPLLERLGAFYKRVDGDVVLDIPTLLGLVEEQDFLTGFDEVWLCAHIPKSNKPELFRMTSDTRLSGVPPAELAEWMLASGCVVGLGDGDGLNVATFDRALAVALATGDGLAD